MKNLLYIFAFTIIFASISCEKEKIMIVNDESTNVDATFKSSAPTEAMQDDVEDTETDKDGDVVTDPNEDEDFEIDRKHSNEGK